MNHQESSINISHIDLESPTASNLLHLHKEIEKRNHTFKMWNDYYQGSGLQWKIKGQITRSGYQIIDKLDFDLSEITELNDGTDIGVNSFNNAINKIKRKRRWAEANVIDFAIDEVARAVRGEGDYDFQFKDAIQSINNSFTDFWNLSNGNFNIQKIVKNAKTFGWVPVFVSEDKFKIEDPFNFTFVGDEDEQETFVAIESKFQTAHQINRFFLNNFNIEVGMNKGGIFTCIYNWQTATYFIDGLLVIDFPHNLGVVPVVRIKNPGGSQVKKDIPYQDQINIILTETSEVFKAHLNPAVILKDDGLSNAAKKANAKGEQVQIERGAGTVMIMGKDGAAEYIQWDGLPKGTIETLNVYERHFYNKHGISLFSENSNNSPESGSAKRESRHTLRSNAKDFRSYLNIALQQIANIWLAYKGFFPENLEIMEPAIDEMSEQDRQDIELKNFSVHQNSDIYMKRIGTFTEEEKNIVKESLNQDVILT